jgi:hypothetical protein
MSSVDDVIPNRPQARVLPRAQTSQGLVTGRSASELRYLDRFEVNLMLKTLVSESPASSKRQRRSPSFVGTRVSLDRLCTEYTFPNGALSGKLNAVLLARVLQAEVTEGRNREVTDDYLIKTQFLCTESN